MIWLKWLIARIRSASHDYIYFADMDRIEAGFEPLVIRRPQKEGE